MTLLRSVPLFLVALALCACVNNVQPSELPQYRIGAVNVAVAPEVKVNSDVGAKVRQAAQRAANAYASSLPAAVPTRTLDIRVERVTYKNAVLSILVGSANSIAGSAAVPGAQPRKTIAYVDGQSAVVNGIVGAVIAAGQDRAAVDTKLGTGFGTKAVDHAYGQSGKATPKFVLEKLKGTGGS